MVVGRCHRNSTGVPVEPVQRSNKLEYSYALPIFEIQKIKYFFHSTTDIYVCHTKHHGKLSFMNIFMCFDDV